LIIEPFAATFRCDRETLSNGKIMLQVSKRKVEVHGLQGSN